MAAWKPVQADAAAADSTNAYSAALAARQRSYGPNTSLSYEKPLMVVRGHGVYLYDDQGVSYLDCVNNVTHVGHGNAEVAAAVSTQLHTLNTNSRYLHPDLPRYTRLLLDTLNHSAAAAATAAATATSAAAAATSAAAATAAAATSAAAAGDGRSGSSSSSSSSNSSGYSSRGSGGDSTHALNGCSSSSAAITQVTPSNQISNPARRSASAATTSSRSTTDPALEVLYLVCSGSEANDLALRIIAAARPGATHIAVMGGAYHGHTTALIALSPYKFWGIGGGGRHPHVHVVPCPDPFRGENLDGRAAARAVLAAAERAGGRLGGFFCESILSCGGQVVLPPGYLKDLYDELRAGGVILVADEVQCGFGRCGQAFWGFQTQGVAPDIVTMGKPIGNGYPLAALATTRALAAAFAAPGMEYFNTYGGSTAAVAAGLAVLRLLQRDGLQQHAQQVGVYLLGGLRRLAEGPGGEVIGDVRGLGLFLGVEVVRDRATKRHAPATARWIKERMKARRVLLSTDGPYDNVIKIKPPMVFGFQEAGLLLQQLREVLEQELTIDVRRELERREDELWAAVYGPRQALYRENERVLYVGMPQAKL